MATYLILNIVFLIVIAIILYPITTKLKVNMKVWSLLFSVLIILTLVFDSIIIKLGIVAYDSTKISGLRLGLAPFEDFFYTLLVIILVPSLWLYFNERRILEIRKSLLSSKESLKRLFWVSRPISWPNTAYPFAAGYLVSGGSIDATLVVGTVFFLGPYNLLMYGINDVFDYESDILNPRKGGIEGMKEQKAFHPLIIKASIALCIPFVAFLVQTGSTRSNLILAGLMFFVLAYSAKHLRFKEVPFLDSITSSIHFVGPLIFALALSNTGGSVVPYVLAFFLWGMASHAFGAVQDIVPDRSAKISSIATWFGAKSTVRLSFILYLLSTVILFAQGMPGIIVGLANLLYVANIYKYLNVGDNDSNKTNEAWKRFIWLNMIIGFVITLILLTKLIY